MGEWVNGVGEEQIEWVVGVIDPFKHNSAGSRYRRSAPWQRACALGPS